MDRWRRRSWPMCASRKPRTIFLSIAERHRSAASTGRNAPMAHPVMVTKPKSSALLEHDPLKDVSTEEVYRELLRRLGEDPNRDGLLRTPERVEKSMAYLTKGYHEDPLKLR